MQALVANQLSLSQDQSPAFAASIAFGRVVERLQAKLVLTCLAAVPGEPEEAFMERRRGSTLRALAGHCLIRYAGQTQWEAAGKGD